MKAPFKKTRTANMAKIQPGLVGLLSKPSVLFLVSVLMLVSFGLLFHFNGILDQRRDILLTLTVNAERILSADLEATVSVRLAASNKSRRFIADYDTFRETMKSLMESSLELASNEKLSGSFADLVQALRDVEEIEREAIAFIRDKDWENAVDVISDRSFKREKGLYRANLSQALRELILIGEQRTKDTKQISFAMQVGSIGFFLLIMIIGFIYSKQIRNYQDNLEQSIDERTSELSDKEAHLRAALNNMSDGIYAIDRNLKFTLLNNRYLEFVNMPDGIIELGGDVLKSIKVHAERGDYGPGDPEEIFKQRKRAISDNSPGEIEMLVNNGEKVLSLRRSPMDNGGMVIVLSDITERKEAEEKLRDSEEQYRAFFDNSGVAVCQFDMGLGFVRVNSAWAEMLGYQVSEFDNMTVKDITYPEDMAIGREGVGQILAGGLNVYSVEKRYVKKDGTIMWGVVTVTPIGDADGNVVGTLAIINDTSERKKAEEQLAEKEKLLSLALNNMTDGMYMLDKDMRYILFNKRYLDMADIGDDIVQIGAPMENVVRTHAERGDYGDGDIGEIVSTRMLALASEQAIDAELEIDGGTSFIDVRKAHLSDGGAIVTISDITDRKHAEKSLKDAYGIISGSIDYASNIQRSVLPDGSLFSSLFSEFFVLWEPRDVVGGDMYWCRLWGEGLLIILGDCTGHGVPGAFMTLIATGALDNALSEVPPSQVAALTQRLHQLMQVTLGQHRRDGMSDDGMELGMCYVGPDMNKMTFVGARFELFLMENDNISSIRGTKSGIGYRGIPHAQDFEEHQIVNLESKAFFMASDGIFDQIGGEKRRSFGKKRFKQMLLDLKDKPLPDYKDALYQALIDYQGEENRRDDVSVIGFKI